METENPPTPNADAQSRRRFLQRSGGAAALAVVGASGQTAVAMDDEGRFESDPFSLGVTSGDPLPQSVVLWTRLAPRPLERGGGMPDRKVPVQWVIAADEDLDEIVQRSTVFASPERAHSLHVEVTDLEPDSEYYYQFRAGAERSTIGRTKTLPAPHAAVEEFTFAFASCQAWYNGFYTAYKHMAEDDLDLIIHLGDYIYEYGIGPDGGVRNTSVPQAYRSEASTLERYRLQYGLYKSDSNLRAAHASAPWIVTMDDHEVDNNWADETPQDPNRQSRREFLKRRADAYQAWYEHMPIRPSRRPNGIDLPLYRHFAVGDLAEINVLDGRQYRSDQACGDGVDSDCTERFDPDRTMLGTDQEQWLLENLEASTATWNVLANQAPVLEVDLDAGADKPLYMDPWDGYAAARDRLFTGIVDRDVQNPIVVTGDRHHNLASNLKMDFDDQDSRTVATEFVGTSITSGGDGEAMNDYGREILAANSHIKYFNNQRGYVRCHVTPERWRTDYRVVPYVEDPGAPIRTDATFVVENGTPGVQHEE